MCICRWCLWAAWISPHTWSIVRHSWLKFSLIHVSWDSSRRKLEGRFERNDSKFQMNEEFMADRKSGSHIQLNFTRILIHTNTLGLDCSLYWNLKRLRLQIEFNPVNEGWILGNLTNLLLNLGPSQAQKMFQRPTGGQMLLTDRLHLLIHGVFEVLRCQQVLVSAWSIGWGCKSWKWIYFFQILIDIHLSRHFKISILL